MPHKTDPNDPAINDIDYMSSDGHVHDQTYRNLTKREYFAAMALRGCCEWDALANRQSPDRMGKVENIVSGCVKLADALIAELNKGSDAA